MVLSACVVFKKLPTFWASLETLNARQRIGVIHPTFCDHSGIKLEINNKKTPGKSPDSQVKEKKQKLESILNYVVMKLQTIKLLENKTYTVSRSCVR